MKKNKLTENKNPNRSKLQGIFNVCSKSKVTASSGVSDQSQTNKKKVVVITSITSDIGKYLAEKYSKEGYAIIGTYRSKERLEELKKIPNCYLFFCDLNDKKSTTKFIEDYYRLNITTNLNLFWNIFISCSGTMKPIGNFFNCQFDQWEESIHINALEQLRILHALYKLMDKETSSTVVFFAGGGTNTAPLNYSAYVLSKIMLTKMCELLDAENKEITSFIIGPGWVKTKIHQETIINKDEAGDNYLKTLNFLNSDQGTSMEEIYDCIKWLTEQQKEVVSGRNFSVVHDHWQKPLNKELVEALISNKSMYKLRRDNNNFLT